MKLSIGIDIGGTNTTFGLVSPEGEVRVRDSFRTRDFSDGSVYADELGKRLNALIADTEKDQPDCDWQGIGIGAPNGNIRAGTIEEPPNLKFKGITPLVDLLKDRVPIDHILLTNDANAAALGEKIYGGAKDYDDFVMITLGTGLGSGIFVNGKLVYGHHGFAGELGHISIIPDGRYCGFGRRGSLENYCSATGIRRTFFEVLSQYDKATALDETPIGQIDAKRIADAAHGGDWTCQETIRFTGRLLGEALASAALVTDPQAFFLFGGPVQAGDLLLDPMREAFEKHLIPTYKGKIEIKVSSLPSGDAAILGAAALVA